MSTAINISTNTATSTVTSLETDTEARLLSLDNLEIIDAHFHQWDPFNTPHSLKPITKLFGWNKHLYRAVCNKLVPKDIQSALGRIDYMIQPYLPEDFQRDTAQHNVVAGVFTPYSWSFKSMTELANETQFVEDLFNRRDERVKVELGAIVGNAHLENLTELDQLLKGHKCASPKFRGIRDMIDWNDDPMIHSHARRRDIHLDPAWLQGFERLAEHELFFDAFVYHEQLPIMDNLAKRFSDTQLILSHMGMPLGAMGPYASYGKNAASRENTLKIWQEGIAKLAQNPNVVVKLTGLFLPALGWGFHQRNDTPNKDEIIEKLQPLVDFTIEQFGPDRCMFGSHFAPEKVSISYAMLYDVIKTMIKDRPIEEQIALLSGNARRVYNIQF